MLLYAIDRSEGAKHDLAKELLTAAAAAGQPLMLQSVNEMSAVIARKRLITHAELDATLTLYGELFEFTAPSFGDLGAALQACERHKISSWDALLWATAQRDGCALVLSEDLQDGRVLGGVRFVNPFKLKDRQLHELLG